MTLFGRFCSLLAVEGFWVFLKSFDLRNVTSNQNYSFKSHVSNVAIVARVFISYIHYNTCNRC